MRKAVWLTMYLSAVAFAQVHLESPIWSPNGKRIAFGMSLTGQGTDWNVYLANIDGTGLRQLTRTGAWDAAWSPDGADIVFVSTVAGKRQISSMSVDGPTVIQLTKGDTENFHPSWSPKGTKLAFTCRSGVSSLICVMNADGSDIHAVTNTNQQCRWPTWSPDGKRLAYYSQGEVWTTNLETGERVHLFTMGPATSTLDWSPDGQQILFAAGTEQAGIQVFNISSGETRRILSADWRPGEPRWSSDGHRVLFVAGNSKPGIYCLDVSTSAVREVVSGTKMHN
jgi:Tol biopolymer transport system component